MVQQQMQGAMQVLAAQQQQQQQAHGAAAPRPPPVKLYESARYSGGATLESWLLEISNLAGLHRVLGADKVSFAALHFKGTALQWWTSLPAALQPDEWDAFTDELRRRFLPITSAELARAQLRELVQGKRTVIDYVAAFNALLAHLPAMEAGDRVFAFVHGLNKDVQAHVDEIAHAYLDTAIERAVRFGSRNGRASALAAARRDEPADMQLDAIEELMRDDAGSGSSHEPAPRGAELQDQMRELLAYMREQRRGGASSSSSRGGYAPRGGGSMGAHRLRGLPKIPHLSPNEVKEYMDAGKCFGCGSKEHQSRDCPAKRKSGAGQGN